VRIWDLPPQCKHYNSVYITVGFTAHRPNDERVKRYMSALHLSAMRAVVNNNVKKQLLLRIMIISRDFFSQLHNSRPDFQSRNPVIGRCSSRDFQSVNAARIPGFGISGLQSLHISPLRNAVSLTNFSTALLTSKLPATQFQLLNVSDWSIKNATTPV